MKFLGYFFAGLLGLAVLGVVDPLGWRANFLGSELRAYQGCGAAQGLC